MNQIAKAGFGAAVTLLCSPLALAQYPCYPPTANSVEDGAYHRENIPTKKPVSYSPTREADVMWAKRVWRRIDLRQKQNHSLYYPESPVNGRVSLFDLIRCGVTQEQVLTAYDPGPLGQNDMFTLPLTASEALDIISSEDTAITPNWETGDDEIVIVPNDITSRDVVAYDIKEEWFFDKQRSAMDVRIIGICPLVAVNDETTGEFRGLKPLFWLYFPSMRPLLAQHKVFNRFNSIDDISYDDLFWKRMFGSYIIKESNVADRFIAEYKTGLDALLEADRIKDNIFLMEHDLWSY